MLLFVYWYLDKSKKKRSSIEALSLEEAKKILRENNIIVISIKQSGTGWFKWKILNGLFKKNNNKINAESIILFTSGLLQLLKAGMTCYDSLTFIAQQEEQEYIHNVITCILKDIKEGRSFADALDKFDSIFDYFYRAIIRAGEASGNLVLSLEYLTETLEKNNKRKKQIISALIYPGILLSFSLIVIAMLFIVVVPSLKDLFEDKSVNLVTRIVFCISDFFTNNIILFTSLFCASVASCFLFLKRPKAKVLFYDFLMKIPKVKTLIVASMLGKFGNAMATMLKGDVPADKALKISINLIQIEKFQNIIKKAHNNLIVGLPICNAFENVIWMPKLVSKLITIGETSGQLIEMFDRLSSFYDNELDKQISKLIVLAQPLILIFMGLMIGFVMLAILIPLTDVSSFLT